jgi:murein DD-endopeptidase MepM/ murein hydrolase activator NlpD
MMKHFLLSAVTIPFVILLVFNLKAPSPGMQEGSVKDKASRYTITAVVQPRESLEAIFNKYDLDKLDLSSIYNSSKDIVDLSNLSIGDTYNLILDKKDNRILKMQYEIDNSSFLNVVRKPEGFVAEKVSLAVDRRIGAVFIQIEDSLMNSMPSTHGEYARLAMKLSDIYAWDIDFSSDIRNGDTVKIIAEELWVGEVFKGFGDILAAEVVNNGSTHAAYRFEHDGRADYFDSSGQSLRKALLKSPLKFNYISSRFSKRRRHPKLRIYRPHLGVDYVAPIGTPVSAAGSGTVVFAGYKGQNGRMVKIRHNNGYETYYGHLSRIPQKIRKWTKVSQGDIIGYVGSSGLSTGPHLDYRIKYKGQFVDPLKLKLPQGGSVSHELMALFKKVLDAYDSLIASLREPVIASTPDKKVSG